MRIPNRMYLGIKELLHFNQTDNIGSIGFSRLVRPNDLCEAYLEGKAYLESNEDREFLECASRDLKWAIEAVYKNTTINKEKFKNVCEAGKTNIIFMLQSPDPEIREIAEGLSRFMCNRRG